jgi:hypothetical protein
MADFVRPCVLVIFNRNWWFSTTEKCVKARQENRFVNSRVPSNLSFLALRAVLGPIEYGAFHVSLCHCG